MHQRPPIAVSRTYVLPLDLVNTCRMTEFTDSRSFDENSECGYLFGVAIFYNNYPNTSGAYPITELS